MANYFFVQCDLLGSESIGEPDMVNSLHLLIPEVNIQYCDKHAVCFAFQNCSLFMFIFSALSMNQKMVFMSQSKNHGCCI